MHGRRPVVLSRIQRGTIPGNATRYHRGKEAIMLGDIINLGKQALSEIDQAVDTTVASAFAKRCHLRNPITAAAISTKTARFVLDVSSFKPDSVKVLTSKTKTSGGTLSPRRSVEIRAAVRPLPIGVSLDLSDGGKVTTVSGWENPDWSMTLLAPWIYDVDQVEVQLVDDRVLVITLRRYGNVGDEGLAEATINRTSSGS